MNHQAGKHEEQTQTDSPATQKEPEESTETSMPVSQIEAQPTEAPPSPERIRRIQEITQQIIDGTYQVSAEKVAESILQDLRKRKETLGEE